MCSKIVITTDLNSNTTNSEGVPWGKCGNTYKNLYYVKGFTQKFKET